MAFVPSVFVTPAASALRNLDDALEAAQPGKPLPFASCGNGTPQHLAGEMLARATGAALQQVPYKGCGPALTDVTAGQVPLGIVTASSAAPLIAAGKLRALAVTSPAFAAVAASRHGGRAGREGLCAGPVARLAGARRHAASRDRPHQCRGGAHHVAPGRAGGFARTGFTPATSTPAAFQSMIRADIDRYAALTEAIGLRAD